jgi:DNA helicase HerA-like ATPase
MSKFILPNDILKQHAVILGKTGSGKSSKLRYLVEHLLRQNKRVCVIDPKGDWYGLKAKGTGPGFPVILFGGFKNEDATDVPIKSALMEPVETEKSCGPLFSNSFSL